MFQFCRVNEALMYGAFILSQSVLMAPNFNSTKSCGARILHLINRDPKVKTEFGVQDKQDWVCTEYIFIIFIKSSALSTSRLRPLLTSFKRFCTYSSLQRILKCSLMMSSHHLPHVLYVKLVV